MTNAAKKAVNSLKLEHKQFGLMIDELDHATDALTGQDLLNAIDEITRRYGCSTA